MDQKPVISGTDDNTGSTNVKKLVDFKSSRSNASPVWKYFGFYEIDGEVDKSKAICKICKAEKPYSGGSTSNLNTHLVYYHADVCGKKALDQPTITQKFGFVHQNPLSKDSKEYKEITRKVTEWIVSELLPLSTMSKPSFRNMITSLNSRYTPPCTDTLSAKIIPEMYEEVKSKLLQDLERSQCFACTTDGWTSPAVQSYVTGIH